MKVLARQCPHLAAALALASAVLALSGEDAWSQAGRTIKVVVPFTAGSPSDIPARLLAEQISRRQGVTVIVENRPGGNGTIANEAVSRAVPDGTTLLITTSAFVIDPHLRKLNYHPLTSFELICELTSSPTIIAANSTSAYRSLADLLNAARAKPGVLTTAGVGPASTVHMAFEMLKRAAKVDMTFVPFQGAAPAVSALLGGHVTSVFSPLPGVAQQLRAGKLRGLAASSRTRIEAFPDVPTVAESGYRVYELNVWFGVVAPAQTPKETISKLTDWFTAALQAPEVRTKLIDQGLSPVGACGAQFSALLRERYQEYGRAIRDANIKIE